MDLLEKIDNKIEEIYSGSNLAKDKKKLKATRMDYMDEALNEISPGAAGIKAAKEDAKILEEFRGHIQGITKWLEDFKKMAEYGNFKDADGSFKIIKKAFKDLEKSYSKFRR